jgi:hypothetical protein
MLIPYGTDGGSLTFSLRVYGWESGQNGGETVWVPVLLAEFDCTTVDDALNAEHSSDFICNTITKVDGRDNVEVVTGTTGGSPAYVLLDPLGFSKLQLVARPRHGRVGQRVRQTRL